MRLCTNLCSWWTIKKLVVFTNNTHRHQAYHFVSIHFLVIAMFISWATMFFNNFIFSITFFRIGSSLLHFSFLFFSKHNDDNIATLIFFQHVPWIVFHFLYSILCQIICRFNLYTMKPLKVVFFMQLVHVILQMQDLLNAHVEGETTIL